MVTTAVTRAQSADTIFVLEGGRVVESGSHQELWDQRGLYWAMWKANNNLLPTPLHSLFTKRPNSSSFYLPFRRLDITQRCPSYQGVYLWNETPRKIVLSPSVNSLKANLKDHLLNQL